ncbi:MAG: 4Fe-4S binding protein [Clostridiales bacterium]|jgi:ferredoxin|nr:4Fe-4S binding protein [Clostridiales bacterium]
MGSLEKKLWDFAEKNGIDVLGFAPKSRFDGLQAEYNPFSIFPEGETVIILGKRICRGSLRGVEEGSNFGDYNMFGHSWLEDNFLTIVCYDMTRVLEDNGWEAVPIFPNPTEVLPQGVPVAEGRPAPNVHPDFDYAAVAAGVAEISFNGLLFTPKFGSRQRFHMIITDAVLEPTPVLEKSICDGCGKCADLCPLQAISKTDYNTVTICGKSMRVANIDYSRCAKCKNGAIPNRFTSAGKPDRVAALCNRTCMEHLEQEGLIENTFKNPLRQSEPWALDADGKYAGKIGV